MAAPTPLAPPAPRARGGRHVRFEPVVVDDVVLGFAAVVSDDRGAATRDLDALRLALEAAGGLDGQLLFVGIDVGGIRQAQAQLDAVVEAVGSSEIAPGRVVLQIGVTAALASHVGRAMAGVRRAGIQVAVHEVVPQGSCGCAGLVVDLDWIKVHPCVLERLDAPGTEAALRQLVECTRGLEAEVIADGVRTPEQAEQLHELGIHVQQLPAGAPGPPG